jgi:hypothetical protein
MRHFMSLFAQAGARCCLGVYDTFSPTQATIDCFSTIQGTKQQPTDRYLSMFSIALTACLYIQRARCSQHGMLDTMVQCCSCWTTLHSPLVTKGTSKGVCTVHSAQLRQMCDSGKSVSAVRSTQRGKVQQAATETRLALWNPSVV